MFASIDRIMSERILTHWVSKFGPHLEVANTLRSYEFIYLMANTVNRTKFIQRFVVKPTMDLSRDPNLTYTFKLNQDELRNQRSLNVQIQHAFNHMHHPDHTLLVSKFSFPDQQKDHRKEKKNKMLTMSVSVSKLKKAAGVGGLKSQLEQQNKFMKKLEAFKVQSSDKNLSPMKQILRDPQMYPEIAAKVSSLNLILRRSRYNSGKHGVAGFIESEVQAVHDTRYLDNKTIEDYLQSDTHLAKKHSSIKGFKFRYMNSLIDGNLANRNKFFGGSLKKPSNENLQLESELNRSQEEGNVPASEEGQSHVMGVTEGMSTQHMMLKDFGSSGSKPSQTKQNILVRPMTSVSKRPNTGVTRPWTGFSQHSQLQPGLSAMTKISGETRIDDLVSRELAFFEQGL